MAEYLNSAITGSFTLPLVMSESIANTGSAGGLYYNLSKNRVYYTYCQAGSNAWTSAAAQITQKLYGNAVGTANDAFSAGGGAPGTIYSNDTQEYNGISWASGGNLLFGKLKGGRAGTGTSSGLEIGDRCSGAPGKFVCSGKTQHYDGTGWSLGGSMSYNRYGLAGNGTENAALAFGGVGPGYSIQSATQEYNGSSWSNGGNNINLRQYYTSTGTQNAAIYQGGRQFVSPYCSRLESATYNGTAWSSGPNGITAKTSHGSAGTTNDTYIIGGSTPAGVACAVETFDGTSWSTSPLNLPSVWYTGGGDNANGSGNAVAFSGWDNGNSLAVSYVLENSPGGICTTIIGSYASGSNTLLGSGSAFPSSVSYALSGTWSAGPNRAQCLYAPVVTGDLDSSLAVGGRAMPASGVNGYLKCTEHYDGYSWSTGGALSNGSYLQNMWGSQNAAVRAGGYCYPSPNAQACTEEYNGSSWSTGPNLPASRYGGVSAGTQNDGIMSAGNDGTNQHTTTYTWNGTSWATGTAKITTMRYGGGVGETSDNLFAAQGYINPAVTNIVEHWNGSSWSSCTSAPVAQSAITAGGIGVNDYISASGGGTDTISWNGSAWAAQATSPSVGYNYQSVVRSSKGMMQVGFSQSTPYRACATCLYTRDTN